LNLVKRLFAEVIERCVRRGSTWLFDPWRRRCSTTGVSANKGLMPFVWTADADLIPGKVTRLSKRFSDPGHVSLKKETT
jgi:hypothetical protein